MKKIKDIGKTPKGERVMLMETKQGKRYKIQEYFYNGKICFKKI